MDLSVGRTMLFVFLSIAILATAVIGIYLCIYGRFVNRRIQNKSDRSHGMWPPRTVITTTVAAALVILVCAGLWMSLTMQREAIDPDSAFPLAVVPAEDTEDTYLAAYSKDHNDGYTRYVKTEGGITYTYFVQHGTLDALHPAFLVFVDLPEGATHVGYTAQYGDRPVREQIGIASDGALVIAGNAPGAAIFALQLYFYDAPSNAALQDGKNDPSQALAQSTFRLAIAE